jgi:hypothetical protein
VEAIDRAAANAWAEGGLEAEREIRRKMTVDKQNKFTQSSLDMH